MVKIEPIGILEWLREHKVQIGTIDYGNSYSLKEDDGKSYGRRECDDDYTGCMDTSEDEGNDEYIERYFVEGGAPISDDEEEKSEVPQAGMHTHGDESGDGEKNDMGTEDGAPAKKNSEMSEGDAELMEEDKSINLTEGDALEEDMSTDMKSKMDKRKSLEDGVKSEQNDGAETVIEVKKQKHN